MTNKLFVIIIVLKYQKLRKFYYMKWNFLYQITAASRTPDYGGYRHQISVLSVLCPQLNLLNPRPPNKIPGYATATQHRLTFLLPSVSIGPHSYFSQRMLSKQETQIFNKWKIVPFLASWLHSSYYFKCLLTLNKTVPCVSKDRSAFSWNYLPVAWRNILEIPNLPRHPQGAGERRNASEY